MQRLGWEVCLVTSRIDARREVTLESLCRKTGWQPDCFRSRTVEPYPDLEAKRAYLGQVIRDRRPSALYALDYPRIHKVYKEMGVSCRSVCGPEDLPPVSELSEM